MENSAICKDDTEQDIGEIEANLFSPNDLSKAELQRQENIRSQNEEIDSGGIRNHKNTGRNNREETIQM